MASFGSVFDKFLAILLALFEALGPDKISRNINSVDDTFGDVGNVFERFGTTTHPPGFLNESRFPDFASGDAVCHTAACANYADTSIAKIRTDVDPCDDFYEFACGKFGKSANSALTNSTSLMDGFQSVTALLTNQTFVRTRELLEANTTSGSTAASKAKAVYLACLNSTRARSTQSETSLKSILIEVLGGWPLITPNWNPATFDLYRSVASAKRLGFDSVFRWSVTDNPSNRTQNIIQLGAPVLGLPSPELYTADEAATVRQAYRSLIGNVADLLAGSPSSDRILDIRDFVDFETNVAKTVVSSPQNTSSSLLSISAFVRQYLSTYRLGRELLNLFRNVLSVVQLQSAIDNNSIISVENAGLYGLLGEQVASVERQGNDGKRILANYIGWSIVFSQLPLLPEEYRDALGQFSTASGATFDSMGGVTWEDCLNLVNSAMPNAVAYLYASRYFPLSSKTKIAEISSAVRNAAVRYVNESASWMDARAKLVAVEKINSLVDFTGYPDVILDNVSQLDALYSDVTVTEIHYDNVRNLTRFAMFRDLRKLGQSNGRTLDDEAIPVAANAYYYYDRNLIALSLGLLQAPLYDPEAPDYLNYAGIGYIYAHQLTKTFDETGSLYNASGAGPQSWWSPNVNSTYLTLVNGLRSQYRGFPGPDGAFNGEIGASDVIADSLALQFVLSAYRTKHGGRREPALPRLEEFTPNMQLLLSFAQDWCENTANSGVTESSTSSTRYPMRLRVDIPLINLPDFSEIYKCSSEAKMNSLRKISLSLGY